MGKKSLRVVYTGQAISRQSAFEWSGKESGTNDVITIDGEFSIEHKHTLHINNFLKLLSESIVRSVYIESIWNVSISVFHRSYLPLFLKILHKAENTRYTASSKLTYIMFQSMKRLKACTVWKPGNFFHRTYIIRVISSYLYFKEQLPVDDRLLLLVYFITLNDSLLWPEARHGLQQNTISLL